MDWTPGGSGNDVEDRRDESGGGGGGGFGGSGFGGIHLGIGGTIIVGLLSLVFHSNLFQLFQGGPVNDPSASGSTAPTVPGSGASLDDPGSTGMGRSAQDQAEKPQVDFVKFVLNDVQKNWDAALPAQENRPYRHAKLVLYRDSYPSGCGTAQTATGPFYCPGDEKVYLDLGFFKELKTRFGAPGEFAQAYVIAHEIGHHVQKILGIESKVRQLQQQDRSEVNPLSVKLELQADCFAGVWANSTEQRGLIHEADVTAAINAAGAVGDDRLQRAGQGYVNPESFTHGSSAQRESWFKKGLDSGRISACSTFQQ